jgi:hypothetical protein
LLRLRYHSGGAWSLPVLPVYAILACISEDIVNRAISICSDSRAALLTLKSYALSSRVVLQCGDSLQKLALSNRVRLVWVQRHCGIYGNREADAFPKAGSSSAFVGPERCLPLAPLSVKRREREWLLNAHSRSLETACYQSRMWLKKPNPSLTRYLLRLPRSKLRIFVGLITDHCPLNKHLHKMGLIMSLSASLVGWKTSRHFIF